jgi:transglutaminase-like putative cysteine protease
LAEAKLVDASFLEATDVIDWRHPLVQDKAQQLRGATTLLTIRNCFEWVRDEIEHSADCKRGVVTCSASEVLQSGTGYCYAKSHLLAALLRANGIPAGFCYQRLSINDQGEPFCLHGFNAVYLDDFGWYRLDPRGNKPGIDAQFCPPVERLAFSPTLPGERDFPDILASPLPVVISSLRKHVAWDALGKDLPDAPTLGDSLGA